VPTFDIKRNQPVVFSTSTVGVLYYTKLAS